MLEFTHGKIHIVALSSPQTDYVYQLTDAITLYWYAPNPLSPVSLHNPHIMTVKFPRPVPT